MELGVSENFLQRGGPAAVALFEILPGAWCLVEINDVIQRLTVDGLVANLEAERGVSVKVVRLGVEGVIHL